MHESKQKQANSKSQVNSQARDEQEAEESLLHQEDSLVQQLSGSGNLPNASVHAQMLSRIPGSQIASNPELLLQMQQQFGNSHVSQVVQRARESSGLTNKGESAAAEGNQENKTVLPNNLKVGIENLSGYSMDDVKVHYNSSKPAQLQALAYTQGTNIHVGPGQEKHLPHEAWHVVQQKQGRVKPTIQAKGIAINDNTALEREADVMGRKAFTAGQNVFFGQEVYQPVSRGRPELIAHELTHEDKTGIVQRQDIPTPTDDNEDFANGRDPEENLDGRLDNEMGEEDLHEKKRKRESGQLVLDRSEDIIQLRSEKHQPNLWARTSSHENEVPFWGRTTNNSSNHSLPPLKKCSRSTIANKFTKGSFVDQLIFKQKNGCQGGMQFSIWYAINHGRIK